MNRDEMLMRVTNAPDQWDFIIIGGGSTGVAIAMDAASRGYRTLLLEQHDFGKGASSRTTKLAHGGVRYLQQGNISLVLEALRERGLLRQNAPHLVHDLAFVVPNYDWWEKGFYGIGLKVYDIMAGRHGFGRSRLLSREEVLEKIPTIESKGLRGGVVYYDGQFDDARLNINIAETAAEQGASLLNYCKITSLVKTEDMVSGVIAEDIETGTSHRFGAKVVINATGAFSDSVRKMDKADARPMISPSQGVHIVLPKRFLPGDSAIMVPHTDDGRILFAIPWHGCTIVGTTDTPLNAPDLEPRALPEEIDFLLNHAARYLSDDPRPEDVLSVYAGIRPLVNASDEEKTAALARDHTIHISDTGLLTIAGGKWTTCRKMGEDAVNQAALLAGLELRPCVTTNLNIHGYHRHPGQFETLSVYGSDAPGILDLARRDSGLAQRLHPEHPYIGAQVAWAVRHEMARTVEDFLARRTRALIIDARASIEMAPAVAAIMAAELNRDDQWRDIQIEAYTLLAEGYLLKP